MLDAPCGYGRHSRALAEAGFRVTGVDRSPVLLEEARRRSGGEEWPRWVQADHRELPFEDDSFDCALNLFSSIGYRGEEGDRQTLGELRRVLRPGGSLVLETQHRDRVMAIFRESDWEAARRRPAPRRAPLRPGGRRDRVRADPRDGRRRPPVGHLPIRLYTATELLRLVSEAGFAEVECFGTFAASRSRATRGSSSAPPRGASPRGRERVGGLVSA